MSEKDRRRHVNKNTLRDHWQSKGYEYIFNRFSWNVADNIFDAGIDCELCWSCGRVGRTEMAHIVPRCQGGSDDLDNIFELCSRCHLDAPDTKYPEFFDLFCGQLAQHAESVVMAICEASNRYDIAGIDVDRMVIDVCAKAKECAATHHGRYSLATIKALVESALRSACATR